MYEGIFMSGGNLDILLLEKRDNSYWTQGPGTVWRILASGSILFTPFCFFSLFPTPSPQRTLLSLLGGKQEQRKQIELEN